MNPVKDSNHIFIVRFRREPREIATASPEWRAVVEHVPSGTRKYVRDLDYMAAFFFLYVEDLGVHLPLCLRLRYWFKQWASILWKKN